MVVLTAAAQLPDAAAAGVPLVTDLDGSLLRTNSLIESIFVLIRKDPLRVFEIPLWLAKGVAHFKQRVCRIAVPDVRTLPYRADVIAFLREQRAAGRTVVLATSADAGLAHQIAGETGLFDQVFASDGVTNLSGERKRARLVAEFGLQHFDYIGNAGRDSAVFDAARKALLVSPSPRFARSVALRTPVDRVFEEERHIGKDTLHALRTHHWVKNALVFLPLAAVHHGLEFANVWRALLAFMAFCLCASSVYLLNDLLDLPADRRHPSNKNRKLASGRIPPALALALVPLMLGGGLLIGFHLSAACFGVLGLYFLVMLAYSIGLKDVPLLDVVILSGGYAMRVAAGALALSIPISGWLWAFCAFLFFCLALIKRYAELKIDESVHGAEAAKACGYGIVDKPVILAQGVASGYLSVLVLALYANTENVRHDHVRQGLFTLLCILLFYWINYLWLMTVRGRVPHDPVAFVFKDRVSFWLVLGLAVVALLTI